MRLADYIMKRLVEHGVNHVFMITGGGAMYLNDAVALRRDIKFTCNHHEQACAIGAEGYSRVTGKLGVVVVTSGPGGTNTLTGVCGEWTDSVPVLYISGQIKLETSVESCKELGLRQLGDQEINITDIVRPVTKFAAIVKNPLEIKRLIDKAVYIATHGRPGPVWLDVPLDMQGANIDEQDLAEYDEKEDRIEPDKDKLEHQVAELMGLLKKCERPVLVAGRGIRVAGAEKLFLRVAEKLGIPVLATFNNIDIIPSDHPLYIGRIGTLGGRAGNFALQNSDLLISIGTRNNIRQVSYNWQNFARAANKVIVDIDPAELKKPTVVPDLPIRADAGEFLETILHNVHNFDTQANKNWLDWCVTRKKNYPILSPEFSNNDQPVNLYHFVGTLTNCLKNDDVVVAGNGSACVGLFQVATVKHGQRMFYNSGFATMGYDLPAAIGACIGNGNKRVVCLAGDGSLQMNIQELQTIVQNNLPIKIFYLNNGGYISQKQTQDSFFEGRSIGRDADSGVSFPNIIKIAGAYGISSEVINCHAHMVDKIEKVLNSAGPVICEVIMPTDYKFEPKLSSKRRPDGKLVSKPLEDLSPFLSSEELKKNMIIPILEE